MVLSPSTGSCTQQQLLFIARRNLTHGAAASGAFSASPPLGLPGVMLSASTQGIFTRAGQQEALKNQQILTGNSICFHLSYLQHWQLGLARMESKFGSLKSEFMANTQLPVGQGLFSFCRHPWVLAVILKHLLQIIQDYRN